MSEDHTGHCLCGVVRFRTHGPLREVVACHCSQCRKWSGHYWAATSVPHDRFRLVAAKGLRWFRSSPTAKRGFCGTCGSKLFWQPEGEERIIIVNLSGRGDKDVAQAAEMLLHKKV